jgi:DNA repair ATPase RecN
MSEEYAEAEHAHITSLEQVLAKLDKLLGGSDKPGATPEEHSPVSAEVRAELAKLKAAEDAKAREEARDRDLNEVKQKVEKIPERRPREYRRATSLMGWVTEDDK